MHLTKASCMPFSIRLLGLLLVVPVILLISCNKGGPSLPPPPQEIPVVEVIQRDVPIYREFVGQVFGEQDIPIRARVEGFLQGIHFQEGNTVKKDQLLYSIDSQPYEAEVATQQGRLAEAKTALVKAENELRRKEPVAKTGAISLIDLDAAIADRDAATATVSAAEASLRLSEIQLGYAKIYSPLQGMIGKTEADIGEFVGRFPNPVILNTVSRIDMVNVQFYLTEAEYLTLAREYIERSDGQSKDRIMQLILSDGSLYDETGKADFIDSHVDADTGSMLVQASFPNPDKLLRPGMYCKVKVQLKTTKGALLVPQRCVMELQGQYSVYTVNDSNKVESRQIVVGERIADLWLIEEGLNASEKVVIEGLQYVSSGVEIKPVLTEFKGNAGK
ncbi:MAG: efflux RND transporter periplasmic adaptor subunit [Candidatus Brocadiaceae bacterium]|nr:efflux RND transporter periplasmic adaptor subunit [Candidatus Brocadiaceae bacterium]